MNTIRQNLILRSLLKGVFYGSKGFTCWSRKSRFESWQHYWTRCRFGRHIFSCRKARFRSKVVRPSKRWRRSIRRTESFLFETYLPITWRFFQRLKSWLARKPRQLHFFYNGDNYVESWKRSGFRQLRTASRRYCWNKNGGCNYGEWSFRIAQ